MNVFLSSPWIPPEWISAHGLHPKPVWPAVRGGRRQNRPGVCPFADAFAALAEESPGAAVVFASSCDQMRRLFDEETGASTRFLFNIPAVCDSPVAASMYRSELVRLGRFLETLGGNPPCPDELRALVFAADLTRSDLRRRAMAAAERPSGVPLAIVGGPLTASDRELLRTVERCGGSVVLDATENGERCLAPEIAGADPDADPLDLLVHTYFNKAVDVFQRPNDRLYSWLEARLRARGVRGILLWAYFGCDLWRAELATLRERFDLPVLLIEPGDTPGDEAREITRIEAFLEMLPV